LGPGEKYEKAFQLSTNEFRMRDRGNSPNLQGMARERKNHPLSYQLIQDKRRERSKV